MIFDAYNINKDDNWYKIPSSWNYFAWGIAGIIEQTLIEYNECPHCGALTYRDDNYFYIPYNYDKIKGIYCIKCGKTIKEIKETDLYTEYENDKDIVKVLLKILLQANESKTIMDTIMNSAELEYKIKLRMNEILKNVIIN